MKWLFFFLLSFSALASEPWKEGLHLYLGGGPNLSLYHTEGDSLGEGLHFKTDVGYSFDDRWSAEAGSIVRFTKLHETFIWDTLLSLGVRRKIGSDYFLRVFAGQAPTVFYTNDSPEIYRRSNASRILFTGPAGGLSFGKYLETWFWETTFSYQSLDKARGVRDKASVTEEVFRTDQQGVKIISLSLTFGIVVF